MTPTVKEKEALKAGLKIAWVFVVTAGVAIKDGWSLPLAQEADAILEVLDGELDKVTKPTGK